MAKGMSIYWSEHNSMMFELSPSINGISCGIVPSAEELLDTVMDARGMGYEIDFIDPPKGGFGKPCGDGEREYITQAAHL